MPFPLEEMNSTATMTGSKTIDSGSCATKKMTGASQELVPESLHPHVPFENRAIINLL